MEPLPPASLDVMDGFYNFFSLFFLIFSLSLMTMVPVEFGLDNFTKLNWDIYSICLFFLWFWKKENGDNHLDRKLWTLYSLFNERDVISEDSRLHRTYSNWRPLQRMTWWVKAFMRNVKLLIFDWKLTLPGSKQFHSHMCLFMCTAKNKTDPPLKTQEMVS